MLFVRLTIPISAIIVACLATFRNLFSRESSRQKHEQVAAPGPSNLFLRGSGGQKKVRDILDLMGSMRDHSHSGYQEQSGYTSDSQSIVDHYDHGAHNLDEIPGAV